MKLTAFVSVMFLSFSVFAQQNGEMWEISIQISGEDGRLGSSQVQKLCFPKGKDMKEPPEKDSSCKTTVQHSGKRSTFKSVCRDSDAIITAEGYSEEVAENHIRSDITITTEEKGKKAYQQRQVGSIKKLPGTCNPKEMMGKFVPPQIPNETLPNSITSPTMTQAESPKPDESIQETSKTNGEKKGADQNSMIESGKSLLRGILKF